MKISPCDYLVIGTGNIANRHISNLKELFPQGIIGNISSSGRQIKNSKADIVYENLLQAKENINKFAIIASPASFHLEHAVMLMESQLPILIEKPISNKSSLSKSTKELLLKNIFAIDTAYNYRFHPCLLEFKKIIDQEQLLGKIFSVISEVGQYLPDWRPNKDYRDSVSAHNSLGGGVLLELSHELDYLNWIFGQFKEVFCKTSNSGLLELDVEDCVEAIMTTKKEVNVNLHMDFLQRKPRRNCIVHGEKGSLRLDLINNTISFCGADNHTECLYHEPKYDKNKMYQDMILHFDKVSKLEQKPKVDINQALYIVQLTELMKQSSKQKRVVFLD